MLKDMVAYCLHIHWMVYLGRMPKLGKVDLGQMLMGMVELCRNSKTRQGLLGTNDCGDGGIMPNYFALFMLAIQW